MPHASPSTGSVASSESKNTTNEENPQPGATNRNRGSNWTDAETSYLLELWRDNFPISMKRNSTVWDALAKKLKSIFKDNKGIPSYRTGMQCKARIKYLKDKYKRVKDHNSRSGNNRESFEYYDEMDEVLGSKPNITPKEVVDCGLVEDTNATGVGDSETSPESNFPADHESDTEFENNLKGNTKRSKKGAKEKRLL